MIVHSDRADHGKDHIWSQFLTILPLYRGDFLRAGENGHSSHQQRIADAIVVVKGDGDDRARFEAAR